MKTVVKSGDILDEDVDVLICSANVYLNMSGGVNGAILLRGGEAIQRELKESLNRLGRIWLEPGSIVRTGPGPLRVKHILHAVAIDGFYQSSVSLVSQTIARSLAESACLGARTVALPALATGYGPLTIAAFAAALRDALSQADEPIEELRVITRHPDEAEVVAASLNGRSPADL